MKITPVIWFAAAAGLLVVTLAAEWLTGSEKPAAAQVAARAVVAGVRLPKHAAPDDEEGDAGQEGRDISAWSETIVARPLFTVGRRPPKVKSGSALAANGLPRLSGILVGPAGRRAIFSPDSGKPLVLAEGASLDDGTIRRIGADTVTVSGPKGDLVLRPSFDHNRVPGVPFANGANIQAPNANGFNPGFPRAGFNPAFPQPGIVPQPPPVGSDDSDDSAPNPAPAPVMAVPPAGFRNPMVPRGRE